MESKKCFKCGLEKPISEFYKHPQMADGYLNKCKECTKRDVNNARNNRLEYYRLYDRQRYHNNGHRQRTKKYREKNPEKAKAHSIINNAIRDGKLKRPDRCSMCGVMDVPIEAHHSDYSKPLDVIWVCKSCHWEIHRNLNRLERTINIAIADT